MTDNGQWTMETLLIHLDSLVDALRRENDDRDRLLVQIMDERRDNQAAMFEQYRIDMQRAITKVEESTARRFDAVNQFRETLEHQTNTLLPRAEYEAAHGSVVDRLNSLSDRMNMQEGRMRGLNAGWVYLLGFIAAVGTFASIWLVTQH